MLTMSSDTRKGLVGVIVDETAISRVSEHHSLIYRGYEIQDLAEHYTFKEVVYLILNGELPTLEQFTAFRTKERSYREISPYLIRVIQNFPDTGTPMERLRTAVSYLGMEDPQAEDLSPEANMDKAIRMFARLPTIVATDYRLRRGLERIEPRTDLNYAENFFHMCFGHIPAREVLNCFDKAALLYSELNFTPSTFTSRVVASSLSDIYSAVTAAIGSLKGTLHGGANAAVMRTLLEIGEAKNAQAWIDDALARKQTVIGFGHRVYRRGDPRGPIMYEILLELARLNNGQQWLDIQEIIAKTMLERKNLYPNIDYLAGPAYYLMGFEIELFAPIFAMSRIASWSAHILEQLASNKLIRPVSNYTGPAQRDLPKSAGG